MRVVDETVLEVSDVDGSRATPQASNEWVACTIVDLVQVLLTVVLKLIALPLFDRRPDSRSALLRSAPASVAYCLPGMPCLPCLVKIILNVQ